MKSLLSLILLVLFVSDVDACQRCGLFGRRCRFQQVKVQKVYVQPIVKQPIQYVYPQGQTYYAPQQQVYAQQQSYAQQFSVVQQAQLQATPPALALSLAERMATSGNNNFKATLQFASDTNASIAEIQKIQAVTEGLKLAMGTGNAQAFTLRVENGQMKVEQQSTNSDQQSTINDSQSTVQEPPPLPIGSSLIETHCFKCHNKELSQPKGDYALNMAGLDCDSVLLALKMIDSGKMPKDHKLSPQEQYDIRQEFYQLVKEKQ